MISSTLMTTQIKSPTTSEPNYTDDEKDFFREIQLYQQKTMKTFLTAREYLRIIKAMGYQRVGFSC